MSPIPPGNCGAQFPSACALGNCSRNSSHPLALPYGCVEMGPMEPGRDGTQLGETPGGAGAMGSLDVGRRALHPPPVLWRKNTGGGEDAGERSKRSGREMFCVLGIRLGTCQTFSVGAAQGRDCHAVAHIGLYTAKPFPQRIESDQGHSRDNASAFRRGV
jgi:hypothetical protein